MNAKDAAVSGDTKSCLWWINEAMQDDLSGITQHPMVQAGLGNRNLTPTNSIHCQLFELGESMLDSLIGEYDAPDDM